MTADDFDCADGTAYEQLRTLGGSPAFFGVWAQPEDVWPTTYPTGRRHPRPRNGWQCPGCGRGFSPDILECPYYLEHPKPAAAAELGDEDYER